MMSKLSIIVPVYFNENNLKPLYSDMKEKLFNQGISYELIFVDDGSEDNSYAVMQELAAMDSNIVNIKLSRNFGSHAAILCGLANSTGDCAIIKAADLQEPTELVCEMFESWKAGNNVVLAIRKDREDKSVFSQLYYWMTRKFALKNMPKGGFDVFLLDRKVIDVLNKLDEKNSAITGQILWSGFKTDKIFYTRKAREIGKSKWTLRKKVRLVSDTLFSFSNLPITLVTVTGVISCIGSVIWGVAVLASKILGDIPIQGFTTLFIFQLLSFGVIMITMGILGNYVWRSFDAARNRPVYIIEENDNADNKKADKN